MNTQSTLGNSLAKGLVHQLGRQAHVHAEQEIERLQRRVSCQKSSRGATYREVVMLIKRFMDPGALKYLEYGERKAKVWHGFGVFVDDAGGFELTHYRVPFRNPRDLSHEDAPVYCHPHAHQRLLQIYGNAHPQRIYAVWAAHFACFERLAPETLMQGDKGKVQSVFTFGQGEVLVWRPSSSTYRLWECITAVSLDALYGPKLKAYHRLKSGYRDDDVYELSEQDYQRYVAPQILARINLWSESDQNSATDPRDQSCAKAA